MDIVRDLPGVASSVSPMKSARFGVNFSQPSSLASHNSQTVIFPVVHDEVLFQVGVRCELFLAYETFVHLNTEMRELVTLQIPLSRADFPTIVTRPRLTSSLQIKSSFIRIR